MLDIALSPGNATFLSSLGDIGQTVFPPDTQCWNNLTSTADDRDTDPYSFSDATRICTEKHMEVTQPMVDFLNITKDMNYYFQAYCLNPQSDDSCPFNYCSQSDVAGILVRVSTYIATLCLAIMVFYAEDPEDITEAYWSQILTLYSILVAAVISISQTSLTKFHAIVAIELVASPLTLYVAIYAIRSMFGNKHRLDHLLGRGKIHYRVLALGTVALLITFFIYVMMPSHLQQFSQASCDTKSLVVKLSFLLPVILFAGLIVELGLLGGIIALLPFALVGMSWVMGVYLRRHQLWYGTGRRKNPGFWHVWSTIGKEFPFVHFMAVYMMPYILWVLTVETSLINSNDQSFEASFGQILAIFITVPPLISVAKMTPRFMNWFVDLAWVRFVTRRPQKPVGPTMDETHIPLAISENSVMLNYIGGHAAPGFAADAKDVDDLEA